MLIPALLAFAALTGQDVDTPERRAEDARIVAPFDDAPRWGSREPASGWRFIPSFPVSSGAVWIFTDFDRTGRVEGERSRVIHVAAKVERRRNAPDTLQWADSDDCPALLDRLRAFEATTTPALAVAFLDDAPSNAPRPMTMDGVSWTLWTRFVAEQPDGHTADVSVSSNGGEIARWGEETRQALAPCWRDAEPRPRPRPQ